MSRLRVKRKTPQFSPVREGESISVRQKVPEVAEADLILQGSGVQGSGNRWEGSGLQALDLNLCQALLGRITQRLVLDPMPSEAVLGISDQCGCRRDRATQRVSAAGAPWVWESMRPARLGLWSRRRWRAIMVGVRLGEHRPNLVPRVRDPAWCGGRPREPWIVALKHGY